MLVVVKGASNTWATWPDTVHGTTAQKTPWKLLDVTLFHRYLLTPNEFGPETGAIGSSLKLYFHPYKEHPKMTPNAT